MSQGNSPDIVTEMTKGTWRDKEKARR